MPPNFFICNFIIKKKRKKTKTTKRRWGFLLDCRCQACSEDREVPLTAQGQCLSSWPRSYSCGDFRRWRWFAENRYSRKQRRNLLVVIYDSSLPSSWGWRVDSEATEWPPQQVGRWESGGLTQRRCPINWQRYPGSNDALLGSQITVVKHTFL